MTPVHWSFTWHTHADIKDWKKISFPASYMLSGLFLPPSEGSVSAL